MELASLTSTELTGQYGLAILIIPMRMHSKVARPRPLVYYNGLQLKPVLHCYRCNFSHLKQPFVRHISLKEKEYNSLA